MLPLRNIPLQICIIVRYDPEGKPLPTRASYKLAADNFEVTMTGNTRTVSYDLIK